MSPASPAFLELLAQKAAGRPAVRFDEFMDLALFAPQVGYYQKARPRVGQTPDADFYTASSLGPLFGELIAAACGTLLPRSNLGDYTFVEIGAEPGQSVMAQVTHSFGAVQSLRLGDALTLSGPCIVFSNELFDAQPCRRFVRQRDAWRELGVTWQPDGTLAEILLEASSLPSVLPADAAEGYHLDLPLASVELVHHLARQPWTGLFLAFDYGKSWGQMVSETPQGTARAYHQHRQSNNLLAQPTDQDLTCHVCWDWLAQALVDEGFTNVSWVSQEHFFVRHAQAALAQVAATEASGVSRRKLALMQLLHPANLGQKFQVLTGLRP